MLKEVNQNGQILTFEMISLQWSHSHLACVFIVY